jgi:hypothetical protein
VTIVDRTATPPPDPLAGPVGPAGAGDPVGTADRLRADVADRIGEVLATSSAAVTDVYVGWVAALDAAACPARYRASGADGWGFPGWSPALAGAAIGRAALARELHLVQPCPLPHPLEAVRGWVREVARAPTGPVAEWVAELARSADRATLAAAAANATRWIAGFLRVNGWPLPDRLGLITEAADSPFARRWPKRWKPSRSSSVTVASSPDAVVGKVAASGRFDLLVHRPSSPPDCTLADRAAFETTAAALTVGIVAEHVVISTADCGDRVRFPIDPSALAHGADLVVGTVRQRVLAQDEWGFDDATPSPACRHCPEQANCGPGQQWLAGPGRWRGGLPVL